MASREIKADGGAILPMDIPDELIKKDKSKNTKTAVSKKSEVEVRKKSSKKSTKEASDSTIKSDSKKDSKLVDKNAKQSRAKSKSEKETKNDKVVDTSDTKKAKEDKKTTTKKEPKTKSKTEAKAGEAKTKSGGTKTKSSGVKTKESKTKTSKKDIDKAMKAVRIAKADMAETEKSKTVEVTKGMDLLISFDTTGSMYPVLTQVRREVVEFVHNMQKSVNNIRIGIITHGDYCDKDNPYTIRVLDFTDDIDKISDFVTSTEGTYGGDADECYELVLNVSHKFIDWRDNVNRIMVMIGDANPHGVNYPQNLDHLDWKTEAKKLNDCNIKVFAVHALSYYRRSSRDFYETVSKITGGTYLTLDQFNEITNLILATCCSAYSTEKLNEFVEIIRRDGKMTNSMARNINRLYGKEIIEGVFEDYNSSRTSKPKHTTTGRRTTDETLVQKEGLVPIAPGRFQTIYVDKDCPIKQFVTENGLKFKTGRGFYELSKYEKVQQYKEVIIQNKETGEMFNGAQVREYLGLQPQIASGGVTERLNSHHTKDYRVFVQSTSVNRRLIGGTEMLYEVDDI